MEVMKSEFDLFPVRAVQNSVVRAFKREFTPISAIQPAAPIEFAIPGVPNLYLDLAISELYVRVKIVRSDGANLANTDLFGTINLTLHSMFSNVEVELGSKVISDPNGLYAYRSYLETLLTYSPEVQNTYMQKELWYKDTAGEMAVFHTTGNNATNNGLLKRARYFAGGAEVEMMGRPHCDIFHQGRAILSNVPLRLKFIPSKDKFVIVTPAPAAAQVEYQIKIIECRLYLHSLEVTHSLALAHEQMLHKSNMNYPIRRVTMKHLSIPANHLSVLHDNIYLGAVPERIVVGLVSDSSLNGGYQENPFNFQHFGLNYLALYVNGELIPSKPYQPNFAEHRYIREYNSLVEGMGLLYTDQTLPISREEYEGGYTLYVFDLTPDQNL